MYSIFKLEVLENFCMTRKTRLGTFLMDYAKGDTITTTLSIRKYDDLIEEGKVKAI
ncbi:MULTISPECIES: hypothetical protein [unclassified Psychrobacillus]|uniref:hypothetical protein n=1 Tax=unclassified Psychrobacillus TaxID=2636677 RepID=UPI0030F898EE